MIDLIYIHNITFLQLDLRLFSNFDRCYDL